MVSPSTKRRAIKLSVARGLGRAASACRALGLARSSFYRRGRESLEKRRVRKEVVELSGKHPRYGYRRMTALLRREGFEVNAKRVARIRRQEGLKVSKRQRRMRRLGLSTAQRQRAQRPRQVWSWDFVEDQTENGSRFRILTLIDEHTRESLAIHGGWSIRALDVIMVLEAAIDRYGAPEHLRSDNGPEFIAYAIVKWLAQQKIKTIYITPGSPWENGHIESFHDKLRDECLNRELFGSLLRPESSWNPGAWNTIRCAHIVRLDIEHQTNTLKNWRTNLMGAAPQTPRRSPRQAFGGNYQRHKVANKQKPKH